MNLLPCLCKCSFYEFLYVQGNFQWKMVKKFILFRNEKLLITRFYLEELEGVFCPKKGLTSHSTMHKQLMGEKKWNARLHFNLTSFVFISFFCQNFEWNARDWLWKYFLTCAKILALTNMLSMLWVWICCTSQIKFDILVFV